MKPARNVIARYRMKKIIKDSIVAIHHDGRSILLFYHEAEKYKFMRLFIMAVLCFMIAKLARLSCRLCLEGEY